MTSKPNNRAAAKAVKAGDSDLEEKEDSSPTEAAWQKAIRELDVKYKLREDKLREHLQKQLDDKEIESKQFRYESKQFRDELLTLQDRVKAQGHAYASFTPFAPRVDKPKIPKLTPTNGEPSPAFLEEGLTADMVKKLMEEFQIPSAPVQNQGAREYESCAQVDNESFTHADDERNAPKEVKVLCVQQVGIEPSPKEVKVLRVQQVQNQGAREYESVCAPRRHGLCVHDFSPSADMARKLNFPQNPSAPVQNQGVCEYKSERKSLRTPHKPAILRTPHKPAIPRNAG
jgi:hypothetical protein